MKLSKRGKQRAEKQARKESAKKTGKKSTSRYAIKHDAQKRGFYSETSPLRFGANAEE